VQGPTSTRAYCPPLSKSRVTVYARTLHRACELLGGLDALSRHLGVPAATLARWIGGLEEPPVEAFLAAVDIVLLGAEPGGNYKT
jgi:hypothetical protein